MRKVFSSHRMNLKPPKMPKTTSRQKRKRPVKKVIHERLHLARVGSLKEHTFSKRKSS